MELKTTSNRKLEHLATCSNCGKNLPVEIIDVKGSAVLGVFCKHCKTITIIRIS